MYWVSRTKGSNFNRVNYMKPQLKITPVSHDRWFARPDQEH